MDDIENLPEDPFLEFVYDAPHVAIVRHTETDPPTYELCMDLAYVDMGPFPTHEAAILAGLQLAAQAYASDR